MAFPSTWGFTCSGGWNSPPERLISLTGWIFAVRFIVSVSPVGNCELELLLASAVARGKGERAAVISSLR